MRQDVVLLPIALLLVLPITTSWWVAGSQDSHFHMMCDKYQRSNKNSKMAKLCKEKPFLVKQIHEGIQQAQKECAYQFRHRRWNCTMEGRKQIMAKDTRETAFVNAITAANVAYMITKACVMDENCKCKKQKKHLKYNQASFKLGETVAHQQYLNYSSNLDAVALGAKMFKWGDCDNNIKYGVRISKQWMDSRFKRKSRRDIKTKIMLHNYVAGRLAIQRYMKQDCKCHGLSGSCSVRVCFTRMPPIREVGNRLRERFDGAVKVISGNDGRSSFTPADSTIKPATDEDLVYIDESPDFCAANPGLGVRGVAGRQCNDTSAGEDGCAIMCCGMRPLAKDQVYVKIDQCEFEWCCKVTCRASNVTRLEYVCPGEESDVGLRRLS